MQEDIRNSLQANMRQAHQQLTALLDHPDISSNEQLKGFVKGIKTSATKIADTTVSNKELSDNGNVLLSAKNLVEAAINNENLSELENVDGLLQSHAEEMARSDAEYWERVDLPAGIETSAALQTTQPLTQEPAAKPQKPLPPTPVAETDSTQKGAAKKESTQTAKGIKSQSAGQSFSDSFSSSMSSRLKQGRRELENKSFPMGPLYKALFAAIETSIKNRRAEKAEEANAAREAATVKGEGEAPKAQPAAAPTAAAATVTTTTPTTPTTAPPAANTETITNKHGSVKVTKVAGKADSLSSNNPKALMQAVKDKGYKSFTITSGTPQNAIACMKEGAAAGVPHVAVSKEMEKKILSDPKLAEQYKVEKAKQDKKLAELKQKKSDTTLTGEASQPAPTKELPPEPPTKPLPPDPRNKPNSTLEATDTAKHAPTPMPEEPKLQRPQGPAPQPPAKATTEPAPKLAERSNKEVLEAPQEKKGQALSDQMSTKKMDTQDFTNLKEQMGDDKQYVKALADATSAPVPKPANPPQNDQEKIEQDQSMKAAQDLKDQNLSTARATLTDEQLDSYTQQVQQQGLTKVDNDKPADTEIQALQETQEELMGEEKNGSSQRPADPDTRSSSSSNASNNSQKNNANNTTSANANNNQSNSNAPSNSANSDAPSNTADSNAPNSASSKSSTSSSFDSTTVGNRADNLQQAQQDKQNQLDQSGPSTPSPGGVTPGG